MAEVGVNDIHPHILNQGLGKRTGEIVRQQSIDRLTRNLGKEGILGALGDTPWDAYMGIMDGLESGEVELGRQPHPSLLNVSIRFNSSGARQRFEDVAHPLLAGIHGYGTTPQFRRDGQRNLTAEHFGHEDVSTLGRTGTALLYHQYGRALGPNLPLVAGTIQDIQANGDLPYLPGALTRRIKEQDARLTPALDGKPSFLSSGSLALVGHSMRETLRTNNLPVNMQRPRDNRPRVEEGVTFISTGDEMPRSATTLGGVLKAQLGGRVQEFVDPFRPKGFDLPRAAEGVADVLTGGGLLKLGGAALAAVIAISKATPRALAQPSQYRQATREIARQAYRDGFWESRTK